MSYDVEKKDNDEEENRKSQESPRALDTDHRRPPVRAVYNRTDIVDSTPDNQAETREVA